jgi:hypothetical protein
MKKGKELKINQFKDYNIVFGSVNNRSPKAMYINVSTWAEPNSDGELNYNRIIRDIDKKIRQSIFNLLDSNISTPFLKDRTIVDFDIKKSGVKYGKRSFTNLEITLFQMYEIPVNSNTLWPFIEELVEAVIKDVFEKEKHFSFHKKKK